LDLALFKQTAKHLVSIQDTRYAGFGQKIKFPNEPLLMYLLDSYQRFGNKKNRATVEASLQAMAQGGIYDQVGGGFHRYATDRQWQVPHFEKMLYNQAQLSELYLRAYQLTGKAEYARIAQQTLDYVLADMQSDAGGFYSATDADSNGKEGEFFVWTPTHIKTALSPELAQRAIDLYAVTTQGNFEGHNILHLPLSLESYAQKHAIALPALLIQVEQIRLGLKQQREQRIAPLRDDKIVTAWNAMMIKSLVLAAEVLQQPRYLIGAEKTANFLWQINRQASGELWRIHWQGSSSISANQQDYAYFASALIKLYDQTGNPKWLHKAEQLTDIMIAQFWDHADAGFFMNSAVATAGMMVRPKDIKDNALPASNAVAVNVLAQLSKRTAKLNYLDKATAALTAFSAQIKDQPTSYTGLLSAAALLNYAEMGTTQYAAQG
ncbi:MAG: thioredoxin domain-containing protein, partial [Methyloprofundus sp.]|nr:thioredoxin domain-containing protein [Methyloprofundus sp.]